MKLIETPIKDLVVIESQVFGDDRGWFLEGFNADKFKELGLPTNFVQDNHSYSQQGVLRGLHFQLNPKPQGKLVRCVKGRLWDVAVDLQKNSDTYKQWYAVELSAEKKNMLYVPPGFAHGFYALEECEMLYKCTETYDAKLDSGIAWNDPEINVEWPLEGEPSLSEKDMSAPQLSSIKLDF
ncbi:MAG: dTDP-4-dehydrorhamnose 3,5-epimerase [bacterium]|nr:dTDP-4-dehydrorhamnose 3,5-epimerase [bacterium]